MAMSSLLGPGEDVPEFYVDAARVAATLFTFTLELGVSGIPDTPNSETPVVKRAVIVRMSPHHARILSKILDEQLEKYQAQFGEIHIPAPDAEPPTEGD
jgi:hypothetical protein